MNFYFFNWPNCDSLSVCDVFDETLFVSTAGKNKSAVRLKSRLIRYRVKRPIVFQYESRGKNQSINQSISGFGSLLPDPAANNPSFVCDGTCGDLAVVELQQIKIVLMAEAGKLSFKHHIMYLKGSMPTNIL